MRGQRKTPDAYVIMAILWVFSLAYRAILGCVYLLYKINILPSYKVPPKVISIGNITLGGTGKTPFTIKLAEDVKTMGRRPAVLNRGYGDDESHLLKEKLKDIPVLIGRDRVKNANRASDDLGADCVVLDDGFQHYRLKRDMDILLIDATSPFGNMRLFPGGMLREPLNRLKDADFVILTKSDMGRDNVPSIRKVLKKINSKIEIAESYYKPLSFTKILSQESMPLSRIKDSRMAILSGIANPVYFEWMLVEAGAHVAERFRYPDHHRFTDKDMRDIEKRCLAKDINLVITTEKDAVRLKRLGSLPEDIEIFALKIDFSISSNEEALVGRLHSVFNS